MSLVIIPSDIFVLFFQVFIFLITAAENKACRSENGQDRFFHDNRFIVYLLFLSIEVELNTYPCPPGVELPLRPDIVSSQVGFKRLVCQVEHLSE